MDDLPTRLRAAAHLESAAISPQTTPLMLYAVEAADEIERLKLKLDRIAKHPDTPELLRQYAAGMLG
jgi:hypothetical protein